MDRCGKAWGETSFLFGKNNVEVHRIVGWAGGVSSMHEHTSKWSMFYVETGQLAVIIEKNDYNLVDRTILKAGQTTVIKPGEYHRFEVLQEGTVAFEFYWVELDPHDIVRRDCGQPPPPTGIPVAS